MNRTKRAIIIMFHILLLSQFFIGCKQSQNTEPPFQRAACTNYIHKWKWQLLYMSNHNGNNFKIDARLSLWRAYFYRCAIDMQDTAAGEIPHSIINTINGLDTSISKALNAHYVQNWDSLSTFRGYSCGIDSVSCDTNTSRVGYSRQYKWTYVMKGRIRNILNNNDKVDDFTEAVLAHELGHQIFISGHGNHSGIDNERCIMNNPISDAHVYPYIIFCEGHACELYENTDTSGLVKKGYIASNNNISNTNLSDDFDVIIELDKEEYLEGEPIWLNIKIINKTGQRITLRNFHPLEEGATKITNLEGKLARFHGYISHFLSFTYDFIDEYGEKNFSEELLFKYGLISLRRAIDVDYYFPQGLYSVIFKYTIDSSNIELISKKLSFRVRQPEGFEAEVWGELKKIYQSERDGNYSSMNKLKVFIHKYPESFYTDFAFNDYLIYRSITKQDLKETIEECKYFLEHRHNIAKPRYLYRVISECYLAIEGYESKESAIKFLNEIIEKYPGSEASKSAEAYLHSLEKENK